MLVLVCVLVCVLVLVELCPLQRPWAQGGAGPLGALHQKTRVQLLPEQLVIGGVSWDDQAVGRQCRGRGQCWGRSEHGRAMLVLGLRAERQV